MAFVAVAGGAANAQKHTRVLDAVIRVVEFCAHAAHVRALAEHEHLGQKALAEQLDVVVQKQQLLAPGKPAGEVVHRREVEAALIGDHLQPRVLLLRRLVIFKGGGVGGVVLRHDDLKVVVARFGVKAGKAAVQVLDVVLIRDKHADKGRAGEGVLHPVGAGAALDALRRSFQAHPREVVVDGLFPRRQGVGFGRYSAGGAARVAAPDIKHIGDVGHLFRALGEAQDELKVLAAVVLAALAAARPLKEGPGKSGQVGDVVAAPQIVRLKIGLEVIVHQML